MGRYFANAKELTVIPDRNLISFDLASLDCGSDIDAHMSLDDIELRIFKGDTYGKPHVLTLKAYKTIRKEVLFIFNGDFFSLPIGRYTGYLYLGCRWVGGVNLKLGSSVKYEYFALLDRVLNCTTPDELEEIDYCNTRGACLCDDICVSHQCTRSCRKIEECVPLRSPHFFGGC